MNFAETKLLPTLILAGLSCAGYASAQSAVTASGFMYHHRFFAPQLHSDSSTPPASAVTPSEMVGIYGFDLVANRGAGQTIGIIDWSEDPDIESDLGVFDTYYGLPACTTANGCFKVILSGGTTKKDGDSALEISLDVEWAHAIAPAAKILLIEAPDDPTDADLLTAIDTAVANGATVVSMSFGTGNPATGKPSEPSQETGWDTHFEVPNVTFVASSGDRGYGVGWPAASPDVIAVGGTTLSHSGDIWTGETAWSCNTGVTCIADGGSSGGVSKYEAEPSYQTPFQSQGMRGVPDIAYDANPSTGVAIYDSIPYAEAGFKGGWIQIGGTSMGSPQIAAMIAIANSKRVASGKSTLTMTPGDMYTFTADYHDITSGRNGKCALCYCEPGYDFVTGLGTPEANAVIPALVALP
jgi:subtilase family serine protease